MKHMAVIYDKNRARRILLGSKSQVLALCIDNAPHASFVEKDMEKEKHVLEASNKGQKNKNKRVQVQSSCPVRLGPSESLHES